MSDDSCQIRILSALIAWDRCLAVSEQLARSRDPESYGDGANIYPSMSKLAGQVKR